MRTFNFSLLGKNISLTQKQLGILIGVTLILLLVLYTKVIFPNNRDTVIEKRQSIRRIIVASHKLNQLWRQGTQSKLWKDSFKCKEIPDVKSLDPALTQCNPALLECYFEAQGEDNPSFVIKSKKGNINIYAEKIDGRYTNVITRSNREGPYVPTFAYQVRLTVEEPTDQYLDVLFEDSCNDVFLPRRIFGYGPYINEKRDEDWKWDNFGRFIYMDKFHVSYRKVKNWQKIDSSVKIPNLRKLYDSDDSAAIGLSLEQMKAYCAFEGKVLAGAKEIDAFSFHPGDYEVNRPQRVLRGPYPWNNRRRGNFLYEAIVKKDSFEFRNEYCKQINIKECEKLKKLHSIPKALGWTGIFETLGGPLEAVVNNIDPSRNLQGSSFYFGSSSYWHQIGKRGTWSGSGNGPASIKWTNLSELDGVDFDDPPESKSP